MKKIKLTYSAENLDLTEVRYFAFLHDEDEDEEGMIEFAKEKSSEIEKVISNLDTGHLVVGNLRGDSCEKAYFELYEDDLCIEERMINLPESKVKVIEDKELNVIGFPDENVKEFPKYILAFLRKISRVTFEHEVPDDFNRLKLRYLYQQMFWFFDGNSANPHIGDTTFNPAAFVYENKIYDHRNGESHCTYRYFSDRYKEYEERRVVLLKKKSERTNSYEVLYLKDL